MSKTYLVGIDPGMKGAIAVRCGLTVKIYDIPTTKDVNGKMEVDFRKLAVIVKSIADLKTDGVRIFVVCELSQGMAFTSNSVRSAHHDDSITAWKKGYNYGVIKTMFHAYKLPFSAIPRPVEWKRALKLTDSSLTYAEKKDKARLEAIRLFPELRKHLKRKKDSDRAEALLLTVWTERKFNTE